MAYDTFTSALDTAAAIRSGDVSPVEVVDACLSRIDELDEEINAFNWRNDDEVRAAAKRAEDALSGNGDLPPFHGVPIPIKDLTPVEGWPITYGSHGAPAGPSAESELVVERLRDAGFLFMGRTSTPEFGVITATETLRHGVTHSPWNTERTSGGSSGGAGAAVAAGMAPIAHANDGGGSIRIPASCNGLVGLKPSRSRVPRLVESWGGGVVEGVVSHTVADTAAVLDMICGPDPLAWNNTPAALRPFLDEVGASPGQVRIAVVEEAPLGIPMAPACAEALRATADSLADLGHDVFTAQPLLLDEGLIEPFVAVINAGLSDYPDVDWSKVEPHVAASAQLAHETDSWTYALAMAGLQRATRGLLAPFGQEFDVVLTPTMPIEPVPAGVLMQAAHAANPGEPVPEVVASVAFTIFANITGVPAISLPLHLTEENVPIGVQLTGGPWSEDTLLALSAQLEGAMPWADRRPALATA